MTATDLIKELQNILDAQPDSFDPDVVVFDGVRESDVECLEFVVGVPDDSFDRIVLY